MSHFKKKNKTNISVPTSSMPDIIFQLLIFFMVTTVLRQYEGLKVEIPSAKMIEKLPSKRLVSTIWVDKEGRVVLDEVSINKISDLRTVAYNKLVAEPRLVISLKVDKSADMGTLTDVQQELRKASTLRINYSTIPEG
ncbi:MAG: ExbD/TolR family protein [Calditrichia bacterium]